MSINNFQLKLINDGLEYLINLNEKQSSFIISINNQISSGTLITLSPAQNDFLNSIGSTVARIVGNHHNPNKKIINTDNKESYTPLTGDKEDLKF